MRASRSCLSSVGVGRIVEAPGESKKIAQQKKKKRESRQFHSQEAPKGPHGRITAHIEAICRYGGPKRERYDGRIELLRLSASTVLKTAPRATAAHHSKNDGLAGGRFEARRDLWRAKMMGWQRPPQNRLEERAFDLTTAKTRHRYENRGESKCVGTYHRLGGARRGSLGAVP